MSGIRISGDIRLKMGFFDVNLLDGGVLLIEYRKKNMRYISTYRY